MRAFAIDDFGATGSVHEVPIPEPGAGDVLVAVHAAGVNVMDPLYFSGALKDFMEHRFPLCPGSISPEWLTGRAPTSMDLRRGTRCTGFRLSRSWERARSPNTSSRV